MEKMSTKQNYKDLIVWQRAIDLVPKVYEVLKTFPKEENFALTSQIRRAAVSIPANIAEGQGRMHKKEFAQFLSIAKGSLAELHTLLIIAQRLDYLTPEKLADLEKELAEVAKPLHGLITKLNP